MLFERDRLRDLGERVRDFFLVFERLSIFSASLLLGLDSRTGEDFCLCSGFLGLLDSAFFSFSLSLPLERLRELRAFGFTRCGDGDIDERRSLLAVTVNLMRLLDADMGGGGCSFLTTRDDTDDDDDL